MQQIANRFGRSFCQPFDRSNQSQSKLCLRWCTEIKSFDSRILEFPHDADNVFTWGESHKYFKYPKHSLSTCFTHFRLSEWKGGGTLRKEIIWPIWDAYFSKSWITQFLLFFSFLPLLRLEETQSDQLRLDLGAFCMSVPAHSGISCFPYSYKSCI